MNIPNAKSAQATSAYNYKSFKEKFKTQLEAKIEQEIIKHIADVHDYYNLIKRKNHNYFYLVRRKEKVPQRLEEDEKIRIEKIIWVPIDEAISLYENMQNVLVGKIVKQRELPILKLAKEILDNEEDTTAKTCK